MFGFSGSPVAESVSNIKGGKALVIGSADSTESQVLAEVYAGALNAAGITASTKPNIGSREVYVRAIQAGSVDVVTE